MRFRGENPVYKYSSFDEAYDTDYRATYLGVTTKSVVLLGIIAIVSLYVHIRFQTVGFSGSSILIGMILSPILALIAVIVTHRKPEIAPISSIIYAVLEGLFIGFINVLYMSYFGTEVVQTALLGTFGVLGGMLFLYSTGIIRVGNFFRRALMSMLIGLIFTSLIMVILSLTGVLFTTFYSLYIGVVVLSVVISSLFLLVDFDNITRMVQAGASSKHEWILALGLVVTIVWVYIELLRLVAVLSNRR